MKNFIQTLHQLQQISPNFAIGGSVMLTMFGILTREPGDLDINTTDPKLIEFGKQKQKECEITDVAKMNTSYLDELFTVSGNEDLLAILEHAHSRFIMNGVNICFFNRRDDIEYKIGDFVAGDPLFTLRAKNLFCREKDAIDAATGVTFFEQHGIVNAESKEVRNFLDKNYERFLLPS